MSSEVLADAFDELELELARAGARLSVRRRRRLRRTLAGFAIVSLLAISATASGLVHVAISEQDDPTANHAASALGLSADEASVLLKAQNLGQAAKACFLAHGATVTSDGTLNDPPDATKRACQAEINANEAYLDSPAFAAAMRSATPAIQDAARCFQQYTGVKPGTMIGENGDRPSEATLAAGRAACFRPNGLPK